MESQNAVKRQAKAALLTADKKRAAAAAEYSPFGKGGCGAPLKDDAGQTITSLSKVII